MPGPDGHASLVSVPELGARFFAGSSQVSRSSKLCPRSGWSTVSLAAVGDGELFSHQIEAADLFADGVLHLQTGIDLQEIHLALFGHHEFASAQTDVVDR